MAHEPKYIKVRNRILNDIRRGRYASGSRLPTREKLISDFSVTRTTLNQALKNLVDNGVLSTSRRGGTLVTGKSLPLHAAFISPLTKEQILQSKGESTGLLMCSIILSHGEDIDIDFLDESKADGNLSFINNYDCVVWMQPHDHIMAKLRAYRDKVILINRYLKDCNFISTNHRQAMHEMTLRNINTAGPDCQLFYLDPDSDEFVCRERREGFVDACAERGHFYRICRIDRLRYEDMLNFLLDLPFAPDRKIVMSAGMLGFTGAVIKMASQRNLKFGKNLFYCDFDNPYSLQNTGTKIMSAIQDYSGMGTEVVNALRNFDSEKIACFVPYRIES
jgi:DNA-binding transcriptional regulator YhcF (GntR family)